MWAMRLGREVAPFFTLGDAFYTNWDVAEKVWHHLFFNELRVDPKNHPVLLTEIPLNPKANRERVTQIMFETFEVPFMCIAVQSVLSVFSAGRQSGVVLESGESCTHVVPVYEGYAMQHATRMLDVAGHTLTERLKLLLPPLANNIEGISTVRDTKESLCYVAFDFPAELAAFDEELRVSSTRGLMYSGEDVEDVSRPGSFHLCVRGLSGSMVWQGEVQFDMVIGALLSEIASGGGLPQLIINGARTENRRRFCHYEVDLHVEATLITTKKITKDYELPNGTIVPVGKERFLCPEALFDPGLANKLGKGIHLMVFESVMLADVDLRDDLFGSVVLSGGTTMFPGLADRLHKEVSALASMSNVKVVAAPERKYSVWTGGSILTNEHGLLFQQRLISKAEFQEHGRQIVHKKCV